MNEVSIFWNAESELWQVTDSNVSHLGVGYMFDQNTYKIFKKNIKFTIINYE